MVYLFYYLIGDLEMIRKTTYRYEVKILGKLNFCSVTKRFLTLRKAKEYSAQLLDADVVHTYAVVKAN